MIKHENITAGLHTIVRTKFFKTAFCFLQIHKRQLYSTQVYKRILTNALQKCKGVFSFVLYPSRQFA